MNPGQPEAGRDRPAKVGSYRIEARLGAGGMGVVYRAYDEKLQRPLAIKHLSDRTNPGASRRFRREAQTVARLNHPAIVQIYDIVETEKGDWIVMELVEGERLDHRIGAGKLDVAETIRLGRELAEGLAAAHSQGVIHRDLKASNVMVTKSGRVKILDFGIAKLIGDGTDSTQAGTVLGTCHAMSPEQIEGLTLDHRSDLFALGSLLYEMLTGASPFRGATAAETLARVCRLQQAPLWQVRPEVPRALSHLIDDLLRKDPNLRPRSAAEVASHLAHLDTGSHPPEDAARGDRELDSDRPTLVDGIARRHFSLDATPGSHPSAGSRPVSERRQMTVVCCGLAAIEDPGHASSLDPEIIYETMLQLRGVMQEVADHYNGHLGNVLGHRTLLCFGYPHAHEDDARRAVRAALDLVSRAGQIEVGSDRGLPIHLALRIGIHTGPAIVATSPGAREPITLGATLDPATGLESMAEPESVIVSPATFSLLQKSFVATALEPMRLAGYSGPVVPHRVLEPLDAPDESTTALTPLVGRGQEIELLLSRFHLACEGNGQTVLISGEAGIGKSRLVLALRQHAERAGTPWLSCHASPYAQSSPLQPVIGLLRRLLVRQSGDTPQEQLASLLRDHALEEALPLVALLLDLRLEGAPPAPSLSPERQREKTLDALVTLPLSMAERQPFILVVEDLHWLDPSTLEWLDRLIDQVATVPLFLVLTFRLHSLEIPWRPRTHLTQITLGPLRNEDAERLVAQVLEDRSLPREIQQQIVARTDGVPLFIEELTRAVLESGASGEQRELPATLRESLTARLDRLGTAKEVAQLASVIGRVFSLDLLAAVADRDEDVLRREIERLIQAGLVHRKGFGKQARYLFKHALVQNAAYDSLLKRERQQWHRRIAEALEAGFPETAESQPELLAQHFQEGGLGEPAIRYWFRAGQLASHRSASQEAIQQFRTALQLLAGLPEGPARDRRELEIQNALAAAMLTGQGYLDPAVEQAYARARELSERTGQSPEHFWIVQGLHLHLQVRGDLPEALGLAHHLLRHAESEGDPVLLSAACFCLGTCSFFLADFPAALPLLERAFELAPPDDATYRNQTGTDLRVLALGFGSLVLWHLGHPDQARRRAAEAIALAEELAHPHTRVAARVFAGAELHHYLRDAPAVGTHAREILQLSEEWGFLHWLPEGNVFLAWSELHAAEVQPGARAARDLASVRRIIEEHGGVADSYFLSMLAELLLLEGRWEEAESVLERAFGLVASRGLWFWDVELHRLRGELLARRTDGADPEGAEHSFHTALDLARRQGSRSLALRAALSLGRLWRGLDRDDEARALVADLSGGITEGVDTSDLREVREFLETSMDEIRRVTE